MLLNEILRCLDYTFQIAGKKYLLYASPEIIPKN